MEGIRLKHQKRNMYKSRKDHRWRMLKFHPEKYLFSIIYHFKNLQFKFQLNLLNNYQLLSSTIEYKHHRIHLLVYNILTPWDQKANQVNQSKKEITKILRSILINFIKVTLLMKGIINIIFWDKRLMENYVRYIRNN